ncbi:MAG TPA: hypothetical protein VFR90_15555 [Methylibium sp.]|uniref:hypothetical protein n=1 Tax=Methylibium sp. TaxID=2067992 RepID=UPI002DBD5ADA|nr:hypothetical protein [Methylibium sp.]HEU4460536.1 hypothetical protein [Methylibium sp.]
MSDDPAHPANPLDLARASYAAGRYAQALGEARGLWLDREGDLQARGHAGQLAAQAAYRLGEYGQARELLEPVAQLLGVSGQAPERFDLLAVAVVVHGELGHYGDALEALRLLHAHGARTASLTNHVRARGTAALCLALIGDPWAALRLLAEAAGHLRALPDAAPLEATVCTNHASVCLQAARLLRESGDEAACLAQVAAATVSTARTRQLAAERHDSRLAAFTGVHEAEAALLRGEPHEALPVLEAALARALAHDLRGHARRLRLLLAQAQAATGDDARADATLDQLQAALDEGHEWQSHLGLHEQRHAVRSRLGDTAGALRSLRTWRELQLRRHARQLEAQSRFLRLRLELEHLYKQPWRA